MTVLGTRARATFIGHLRRPTHPMRAVATTPLASLLLLLLAPLAAARGGMPTPLTERGQIIEEIYYQIFIAGVLVFLFVMALLIYVMIRFRASSGHGRATFEHERENLKLEMTWIVIPLFIMLWIGFISYAGLVQLDEGVANEDAEFTLDITGIQWAWIAEYEDFAMVSEVDTMGTVNEATTFYVPADVPVLLRLTSDDVIHAYHIMDANWATVGLVDANPTGPHEVNSMVIKFAPGEYKVQCREMCFNPGHGYMRAKMMAVPQAEFDSWYADTLAAKTAPKLNYAVEVTAAGINHDAVLKTAPGAAVRFQFANDRPGAVVFTDGTNNVTVPAGAVGNLDILPSEIGSIEITSDAGDSLTLEVVEARKADVELGDFYISPSNIQLEAGELYEFTVTNVGSPRHNLFIGDYDGPSVKTTLWSSATIEGGETTTFLALPSEAMRFDTWCDIPGHVAAGMLASATAT